MSRPLRLRAHAKVNLALRVGRRGDDGYHPVATVLQTVSLCDLLFARRLTGPDAAGLDDELPLRLTVEGAELPPDNTVTEAVRRLAAEVRAHGIEPAPLAIRLRKRVPMGAGLGGGSSDAVAALAACVRLWHLGPELLGEAGTLQSIAEQVGADVPFFLTGGTALGTGRGTRIERLLPLERTWMVVAAPDIHVATAEAYGRFDDGMSSAAGATPPLIPPVPDYQPRLDAAWMGNDLADAVCAAHPEIERVGRALHEQGAERVQMTGSGAASFGAFGDRRAATRAAAALRTQGLYAVACVTVDAAVHRRGLFGPAAG